MPRFTYDAFQQDGSSVSGSLEARDEIQALELISGRGLTPVDIKLGSAREPWWSREFSLTGASSVRAKDLEAFFGSFATLLEAKLPLPRTLAFCETQANNYELKNSIAERRSDLVSLYPN